MLKNILSEINMNFHNLALFESKGVYIFMYFTVVFLNDFKNKRGCLFEYIYIYTTVGYEKKMIIVMHFETAFK